MEGPTQVFSERVEGPVHLVDHLDGLVCNVEQTLRLVLVSTLLERRELGVHTALGCGAELSPLADLFLDFEIHGVVHLEGDLRERPTSTTSGAPCGLEKLVHSVGPLPDSTEEREGLSGALIASRGELPVRVVGDAVAHVHSLCRPARQDDLQAVQRDVVCLDAQNGTTSARSTSTASVRMSSDAPPRSREIMPWSLSSS